LWGLIAGSGLVSLCGWDYRWVVISVVYLLVRWLLGCLMVLSRGQASPSSAEPGSDTHTFHLHGHRWTIPGPDGNDPATIQSSPQNHPVSRLEDTRLPGPANSLAFTIDGKSGSFMRVGGPAPDASLGEWHMHCHVLDHMMTGMMGPIADHPGRRIRIRLPSGVPCPPDTGGTTSGGTEVHLTASAQFSPRAIMVNAGDTVTRKWDDGTEHSVTSGTSVWDSGVKSGGPPFPSSLAPLPPPASSRTTASSTAPPAGSACQGRSS
jgi:hypothetical protein